MYVPIQLNITNTLLFHGVNPYTKKKMAAKMHKIMDKSKGFDQNNFILYFLETKSFGYNVLFSFYGSSICLVSNQPLGPSSFLLPHLEIQDGHQDGL